MKIAQVTGQAIINAFMALLNSGTITLYSGTQPTNPDTALSGNTAGVTYTYSASAGSAAVISGGYAQSTASFVSNSVLPTNAVTVTFARNFESGGSTVVTDLTVGTSSTDLIIGNTALQTGVYVNFTSLVFKMPVD